MPSKKLHRYLFFLFALEGAAVMAALFLIPSEGGTLSRARLILIAIPFVLATLSFGAALQPWIDLDRLARPAFIILFTTLALAFGALLFLLRYLDPQRFLSLYQRLSPILWYFLLIYLQTSLSLLYIYRGIDFQYLDSRKSIYRPALIVFIILLIVFIFVAVTRLGVTFDPAYWGEPGVPLMGWQFALTLILGLAILYIGFVARERVLDIWLLIFVYITMLVICLTVPVNVLKNSFYMPITSPSQVPYPYADSAYYDQMAQSLLIGHPYQGVIPTRPLYILFLNILHLLFGQSYARIIIGQTIVLALLPVLLYRLGKKLHSQTAGIVVAFFFIFREFTSLLILSQTRVTNTKMLLVDLPTMFLLLLSCLFVFRWLQRKDWISALAAGGMFGVLLLLRTQSLFVLPFIILAALLILGWRNVSFYRHVVIFIFGVAISIFPWLLHNYVVNGEFAFDAAFENRLLISQYVFQGNAAIQNLNTEGMGLGRILIEFALRDPKHIFGFISNHFLATQVNGLLALPLIEPYNGLFEPVNLYWMNWDGHTAWYNVVLLIVYLAVISIGFGAAWKRWHWLGILPLGFSIGYALATALSRFSSWRYDYPADWIWYFYFGIGFAELLSQSALVFGAKAETVISTESVAPGTSPTPSMRRGLILTSVFTLIGFSPWLITNLASPRYADQSSETLRSKLVSMSNVPKEIESFSSQPDVFFQTGRLLYPRFFRPNTGLSSANPSPAYKVRDFARLGFLLLNQTSTAAVFPTRQVPGEIPHAEDVIVLGCQKDDYVEARLIAFTTLDIFYVSVPLTEPCTP
jgi:4-amino-4-deoxy-L-arabinose transferase-like glycosyltransferase